MAQRSVALDISVRNLAEARRQLLSLGDDGKAALERIEQGGAQAARGASAS